MRTPLQPLRAALLAACLLPSAAAAGVWTLRAGAEYNQNDTWANDTRTTVPRLDVDLALDAAGALGGPGMVDWAGAAQYRRTATDGNADVQNRLAYSLRTTAFSAPNSPITFGANARRRDESFTTEGVTAGSLVENGFGGEFLLRPDGTRPWLRGSYGYAKADQDTLAFGRTERTLQTVGAATGFGSPSFTYNAAYGGNFSEGTFLTDKFQDHRLDADADAAVGPRTRVRFSDVYFLREPTALAGVNPRQELTSFAATLTHAALGGSSHAGTYSYAHAVQSLPTSDVQRTQHRVGYLASTPLPDPEWSLRGGANATYNENRLGPTQTWDAGQSIYALATWSRTRPEWGVSLRGGPTVGLIEPQGKDTELAWGAAAGVTHSRTASATTSLSYDVSYNENLGAERGWAFRQSASGTASFRLGLASLAGTLQASSERHQTDLFGTTASRLLQTVLSYRYRLSEVSFQAGLQDGVSGRLSASDTLGDGIFIAPAYDSRSWFTTLQGRTNVARYVSLRARLRHSSSDLPDRPSYGESEAQAAVDFSYGALRLAVEETYVVTDVQGGQIRVNQIFVRAYRVFGSRF